MLSYESFFNIISFIFDNQVSKQVAGEFLQEMANTAKMFNKEVQI